MKNSELLHLAALLHDIGKFRQRAIDRYKKHQEHSYEFVNNDFADFFAPCGDLFKNAIRHHHRNPTQLQHLIEKQVILADRLSATEREDEEREGEDFVESALVSILSRLEGAGQEYHYPLRELSLAHLLTGDVAYTLTPLSGWVSASGTAAHRKQINMFAEGSVLHIGEEPIGRLVDLRPDNWSHPVYRYGYAWRVGITGASE